MHEVTHTQSFFWHWFLFQLVPLSFEVLSRVTNRRQQGYTPCYGCFDYLFAPIAALGDVWYYMYNDKRVRINGFDHVDKAAEVLKVKVKRFLMYFIICILFIIMNYILNYFKSTLISISNMHMWVATKRPWSCTHLFI